MKLPFELDHDADMLDVVFGIPEERSAEIDEYIKSEEFLDELTGGEDEEMVSLTDIFVTVMSKVPKDEREAHYCAVCIFPHIMERIHLTSSLFGG